MIIQMNIQRKFNVGYARAGRIIDQMEERGIISGYQGSKPRQVLMSKERWEELKMGTPSEDNKEQIQKKGGEDMLEKFIKKDSNEILENVLAQKDVDERTKNLLQGILYKIDVSYKDYQNAKVIQRNKKEYVDEINKNIKRKCNKIVTVSFNEKIEEEKIKKSLEKNKFYIDENQIITYPIEEKILYAIEKSINNNKIVNSKYEIISEPLSNLIMTGKSLDRVEVLRDFNGWSWTTIKTEIERRREE